MMVRPVTGVVTATSAIAAADLAALPLVASCLKEASGLESALRQWRMQLVSEYLQMPRGSSRRLLTSARTLFERIPR